MIRSVSSSNRKEGRSIESKIYNLWPETKCWFKIAWFCYHTLLSLDPPHVMLLLRKIFVGSSTLHFTWLKAIIILLLIISTLSKYLLSQSPNSCICSWAIAPPQNYQNKCTINNRFCHGKTTTYKLISPCNCNQF